MQGGPPGEVVHFSAHRFTAKDLHAARHPEEVPRRPVCTVLYVPYSLSLLYYMCHIHCMYGLICAIFTVFTVIYVPYSLSLLS